MKIRDVLKKIYVWSRAERNYLLQIHICEVIFIVSDPEAHIICYNNTMKVEWVITITMIIIRINFETPHPLWADGPEHRSLQLLQLVTAVTQSNIPKLR